MDKTRNIKRIVEGDLVIEGAGVKLNRIFGFYEVPLFDPFLLLDHFKSDDPQDYIAGFPWHPHRGIETVTYMLKGAVEHGDSLGNSGVISSGDVQWMTAGSGIIHQELPLENADGIDGFQLWVNLPSSKKMTKPRYQEIKGESIPIVVLDNNVKIKVICGEVNGVRGPVGDIAVDPEYLDIHVPENTDFEYRVSEEKNVFAYVYSGTGYFSESNKMVSEKRAVLFGNGNSIKITTKDESLQFLLISGKPLKEKVIWRGPIVMNTEEEIIHAFEEYHNGNFIKKD